MIFQVFMAAVVGSSSAFTPSLLQSSPRLHQRFALTARPDNLLALVFATV